MATYTYRYTQFRQKIDLRLKLINLLSAKCLLIKQGKTKILHGTITEPIKLFVIKIEPLVPKLQLFSRDWQKIEFITGICETREATGISRASIYKEEYVNGWI